MKATSLLRTLDALDHRRLDFALAFVTIEDLPQAARGKELEKLVVALFRREQIKAQLDPGAAAPRQTDAIFAFEGVEFLTEVKWRGHASDVNDLDSLRARLGRVPSNFGGCFVSMQGYTGTFLSQVRDNRTREIILIDGGEVRAVIRNEISLRNLLHEKRSRFRAQGEIWFWSERREGPPALPPSQRMIIGKSRRRVPSWSTSSQHGDLHFAIEHHPVEFFPDSFELRMRPSVEGVEGLARLISLVHEHLDLEGSSSFALYQSERSWFGFGAKDLLAEIRRRSKRYAAYPKERVHHSESFTFADAFRGGYFTLEGRVTSTAKDWVHSVHVSLVTAGVPLDTERYRELAERLDRSDIEFRPSLREFRRDGRYRFSKPPEVNAVALIGPTVEARDGEKGWAQGLVVSNPYFGKEAELRSLGVDGHWVSDFARAETLISRLRSGHHLGDKVSAYRLVALEYTQIGEISLMVPSVDWDEIVACKDEGRTNPRVIKARLKAIAADHFASRNAERRLEGRAPRRRANRPEQPKHR